MNLSNLYSDVKLHVPLSPDILLARALNDAARQFCARALCWEEDLDPIIPVAGQTTYDLDLPGGAVLVKVYGLSGVGVVDLVEKTVMFDEVPTETVTLRVALQPSRTATTIPDVVGERFGEAIAAGAIARMLIMPGKEWTNPQMAAYHMGVYEAGVSDALVRRARGNSDHSLTVRPYAYGL